MWGLVGDEDKWVLPVTLHPLQKRRPATFRRIRHQKQMTTHNSEASYNKQQAQSGRPFSPPYGWCNNLTTLNITHKIFGLPI